MSAEDLAKQFEGCVLSAYQDIAGVWTIGYGHTGKDVYQGLVWMQQQANDALEHDLNSSATLLAMYSPGLSDGPLAALTDFVFNLGIGNYRTSTLCKCVNVQDFGMELRAQIAHMGSLKRKSHTRTSKAKRGRGQRML